MDFIVPKRGLLGCAGHDAFHGVEHVSSQMMTGVKLCRSRRLPSADGIAFSEMDRLPAEDDDDVLRNGEEGYMGEPRMGEHGAAHEELVQVPLVLGGLVCSPVLDYKLGPNHKANLALQLPSTHAETGPNLYEPTAKPTCIPTPNTGTALVIRRLVSGTS